MSGPVGITFWAVFGAGVLLGIAAISLYRVLVDMWCEYHEPIDAGLRLVDDDDWDGAA